MRILFIHGMAQGGKDPVTLKQTWIDTLNKGLAAAGKTLPDGVSFDFPFYGDKLVSFTSATALPMPKDVLAKGGPGGKDLKFEEFTESVLKDMLKQSVLTEKDVEAEMDENDALVQEKAFQNWTWVRNIARAIDKHFPSMTEKAIEQFLSEVYLYVNSPGVTQSINAIVEKMLTDEPTVVVSHSLGTVVGYKVIMSNQSRLHLCKHVTIGSPLGIEAISSKLGIPENIALDGWYNTYDKDDIVALNPLNEKYFPTDPSIDNNNSVNNHTDNEHGIIGYLNDKNVAKVIADSCAHS